MGTNVEEGGYNPERYARGAAGSDKADGDNDSAGRFVKGHTHSLRLHLADGVHAMLYGGALGWPWMNPAGTVIEIPSSGRYRAVDGWAEGEWLVVIKGTRLEAVFDQIAEARRLSVRVTDGDVAKDKPVIESIRVESHELG